MATTKKGKTSTTAAQPAKTRVKTTAAKDGAATKAKKTSPEASTTASATPKKKSATVKLTENQTNFLKKIEAAGELGHEPANKAEERTIEALKTRKLIKQGTKNKASGKYRYLISAAGTKFLSSSATPPTAPTA